jgi:hypothetical protein
MICTDCQAEIVTGPTNPCQSTFFSRSGVSGRLEHRCEECARRWGMACWDEEEQGPYPLMPPTLPGRA